VDVEGVARELGDDVGLVTVEKVGMVIKVALKEYDPTKKKWDRVAGKLRPLGGKWISDGKMSHWAVPAKSVTVKPMISDDEFEDVWKAAGNAKVALDRLADEIGKLQAKREKAK